MLFGFYFTIFLVSKGGFCGTSYRFVQIYIKIAYNSSIGKMGMEDSFEILLKLKIS